MRILISGAGIAGSTLAWFLVRLGHKVTVLERSEQMLAQGQNIDISDGAIEILRKIGVLEEVRKLNTTEKGTVFLGRDGNPIASFPATGDGPSPTSEFEILRGDLAMILYNATKDHPNADYQFGNTIKDLISNTDSSVTVKLSDGKEYEYDIAVAADGQWSKLRRNAFPSDSVKIVDRNAYCVYYTIPRQPEDTEWWSIYWGLKARVITLRPDPHGTMRAALTKMPLSADEKQVWEAALRKDRKEQQALIEKHFADAGWQTRRFLDAMSESPDFYLQGLQQIKMQKWSTGRVVCVGDAAWTATPITGQGTTLAVVGAYLLAGELSRLQPDEDPRIAFDAFDKLYHAHTEKVQDIPSFVPGIAHPASKWHLWALQTALATAGRVLPWYTKLFGSSGESGGGFKLPEYPVLYAGDAKA